MGDMVIVAFRPKPGCAAALAALVADHVPLLRAWGFATDRPALAMRAPDDSLMEVFEWREEGMKAAHDDPRIHDLWARFGAVCDYVPPAEVAGMAALFTAFVPLD